MNTPAEHLLNDLRRLLERLRTHGYCVGLRELGAMQHLLETLRRQGRLPREEDDRWREQANRELRGMLRAILCRSPQEQKAFDLHFNAWREELEGRPPRTAAEPPAAKTSKKQHRHPWILLFLAVLSGIVVFFNYTALYNGATRLYEQYLPLDLPADKDPGQIHQPPIKPPVEPPVKPPVKPPVEPPVKPPIKPPVEPPLKPPVKPPLEPQAKKPYLPWVLGLLLLWLTLSRFNRRYLRRYFIAAAPDFARLELSAPARRLYQSVGLQGLAQQLHRHVPGGDGQLDAAATLEHTLHNLGLFTPIHSLSLRRPEYLALVERHSSADQQSRLIESLLARLRREGVVLETWYFQDDPRWCYPWPKPRLAPDFSGNPHIPRSLDELAAHYAERRLLIFASGHRFLDPLHGKPAEWLKLLNPWPERALFTLEPEGQWRYLSKLLQHEDLLVAPADEHGLRNFLHSIQSDMPFHKRMRPRRYPALLNSETERWLERRPPSLAEQTALLRQLRHYLDEGAYIWLCACAVYPELHWQLTLHLGERLKVLHEDRLADLAVLPWLRRGYLPDWLRRALLDSLPWQQRHRLRSLFRKILKDSARPGASRDLSTGLADPGAAAKTPRRGRRGDRICLDFLAGSLGIPLPAKLVPAPSGPRRKVFIIALLAAVAGLAAWADYPRSWLTQALTDWTAPHGEQQAIGRLDLRTEPAMLQVEITHDDNSVAMRRENVSDGDTLWLRAGEQTLQARTKRFETKEYRVNIRAEQSAILEIRLFPLAKSNRDDDGDGVRPPSGIFEAIAKVTPLSGGSPLTVTLDGSGSTGNIKKYEWVMDGKIISNRITLARILEDIGVYFFTLRVTEQGSGKTTADTAFVYVWELNAVADATPLKVHVSSPDEKFPVTFESKNSIGDIKEYDWRIVDGTFIGDTSVVVVPFYSIGEYTIELEVTDGKGDTDTDRISVQVVNKPIVEISANPLSGQPPLTVSLNGGRSKAVPGFEIMPGGYRWISSDGSPVIPDARNPASASVTYNAIGTYTVVLEVTDTSGKKGTGSIEINMIDEPIVKIATMEQALGPRPLTLTLKGNESVASSEGDNIVKYKWTFSDREDVFEGAEPPPVIFDSYGTHIVTLEVTDNLGKMATDRLEVKVKRFMLSQFKTGGYIIGDAFTFDLHFNLTDEYIQCAGEDPSKFQLWLAAAIMDDPDTIYYIVKEDDGTIGFSIDPRPYTDEVLSSPIEAVFPISAGIVSDGYIPGIYMMTASLVSVNANFPADYQISTCKDPSDSNSLIFTSPLIEFTGE